MPNEKIATRRPVRGIVAVVASIGATMIAAAAIIVPILLAQGSSSTDASTLEVGAGDTADTTMPTNALNISGGIEEKRPQPDKFWRIPVSAPLLSFPVPADLANERCSDAQLAWLAEHAVVTDVSLNLVTLRNAATTGGALSIEKIRFAGVEAPGEPWVTLRCPEGDMGDVTPPPVMIPVDGSPATWGYSSYDDAPPEGSPATINLAPGEIYHGYFIEQGTASHDQRGPVIGDLADGSGTVVLIDDLRVDRPPVPGYHLFLLPWGDGGLTCEVPDPSGAYDSYGNPVTITYDCTPAEAAELLRDAGARGD